MGKPWAVVPAAGASRRMGRPKLLLPWSEGGTGEGDTGEGDTGGADTVLGSLLAALRAGGAGRVALVLAPTEASSRGRAAEELAAWAADFPDVTLAENPAPERGMLSSILAGLDALGGAGALAASATPLLVTPADLPALRASTVASVASALANGAPLAVPTHRGRRGHPLGIAPALLPEIPRLDLDQGLRQLLERHPGELVEVPVDDPGAVRDVDTPRQYEELAAAGLAGDDPPEPVG